MSARSPIDARARSLGAADHADDAGAADRRLDLVAAEGAKPLGDEFRRLLDVVHDLGVLMDLAAPGSNFGNEVVDGGADRHRKGSSAEQPTGCRRAQARCQRARRSALAVQEKNRLIAEEIPRPWREDRIAAAGP